MITKHGLERELRFYDRIEEEEQTNQEQQSSQLNVLLFRLLLHVITPFKKRTSQSTCA